MSPAENEGPSDIRRRRAERSQGDIWQSRARRAIKPLAAVIVLLVLALVAIGASQIPGIQREPEPGRTMRHWHAGFKIYIAGQELDLHKCQFDLDGCDGHKGTGYVAAHMHYTDRSRYMLHIEHPVDLGNVTLWHLFDRTGWELTNTSLRLEDRVYNGELYENNATHTWQLWVQHCVDEPPRWTRDMVLTDYVPLQHDRFLLTYTDQPFEALTPQLDSIPTSDAMFDDEGGACPRVIRTVTSGPSG